MEKRNILSSKSVIVHEFCAKFDVVVPFFPTFLSKSDIIFYVFDFIASASSSWCDWRCCWRGDRGRSWGRSPCRSNDCFLFLSKCSQFRQLPVSTCTMKG